MTQEEINQELDGALEELVFNGDVTKETSAIDIQALLTSMVRVTVEEYELYKAHCLQQTLESQLKKQKFTKGQVVALKANEQEGWPRQQAKIVGPSGSGIWMVEVDPHSKDDPDGLREVTEDQIEEITQ